MKKTCLVSKLAYQIDELKAYHLSDLVYQLNEV